tara:strand:- start:5444 stop:6478 length:1035 start_codon:yes stop_codon:yes gene_type:complete
MVEYAKVNGVFGGDAAISGGATAKINGIAYANITKRNGHSKPQLRFIGSLWNENNIYTNTGSFGGGHGNYTRGLATHGGDYEDMIVPYVNNTGSRDDWTPALMFVGTTDTGNTNDDPWAGFVRDGNPDPVGYSVGNPVNWGSWTGSAGFSGSEGTAQYRYVGGYSGSYIVVDYATNNSKSLIFNSNTSSIRMKDGILQPGTTIAQARWATDAKSDVHHTDSWILECSQSASGSLLTWWTYDAGNFTADWPTVQKIKDSGTIHGAVTWTAADNTWAVVVDDSRYDGGNYTADGAVHILTSTTAESGAILQKHLGGQNYVRDVGGVYPMGKKDHRAWEIIIGYFYQ